MLWRCDALDESLRDSQPKLAPAASTATRLCNKAQGWTEGTTLGSGDGGAINPNGVVAGGERRPLVFGHPAATPLGLMGIAARLPRVGAAPTLGFPAQPRWGWSGEASSEPDAYALGAGWRMRPRHFLAGSFSGGGQRPGRCGTRQFKSLQTRALGIECRGIQAPRPDTRPSGAGLLVNRGPML
jgi:hypothetical protein